MPAFATYEPRVHRRRGFAIVERIADDAGVTFDGGWGVLLRAARPDRDREEESP